MVQLDIDKIRLTDITPADYNPRQINDTQLSKLSKSIQDFGLVDPIIINLQNNKIIGGHQRYRVLLDKYTSNDQDLYLLKLGDIGWAFPSTDLTIDSEEHEKALNILLNQTNLMGEWDNEKLETVLKDLKELNFDLELTGFNDYELDLYLDDSLGTFDYQDNEYDDDDELPSDYVDVTGDKANKSYVISIGFDTHEDANKFLEWLNYPRQMTRDTLQFMFSELELDLDKLLDEKLNDKEPIVFMKYTGNVRKMDEKQSNEELSLFYESVPKTTGDDAYDDAMRIRDENM